MKSEEALTANSEPSIGADSDLDKIAQILRERLPQGATPTDFDFQQASLAERMVRQHWKVVKKVAQALLNETTLSEHRFAEIVGQVSA